MDILTVHRTKDVVSLQKNFSSFFFESTSISKVCTFHCLYIRIRDRCYDFKNSSGKTLAQNGVFAQTTASFAKS
jgi:hypothetical protein